MPVIQTAHHAHICGSDELSHFPIKLTNFLIPKRSNEVTKVGTTQSVIHDLDQHRNGLHLLIESVRTHPLRGIVSSKSLRDEAGQIAKRICFTAASAGATSGQILRARTSAGELEPELNLPKPAATYGSGTDFAAQKLANHVERIHVRMQDILALVKQVREYIALSRHLQDLAAETPHTLFVINRGPVSDMGTSGSATSHTTGRVELQVGRVSDGSHVQDQLCVHAQSTFAGGVVVESTSSESLSSTK
ncbi:hypothetical protein B0H11DRAFT_1927925 [Mycena galericulata]|nr:hypothetical protein B0H11DRAFT_1927925 [Mycena galericulata]